MTMTEAPKFNPAFPDRKGYDRVPQIKEGKVVINDFRGVSPKQPSRHGFVNDLRILDRSVCVDVLLCDVEDSPNIPLRAWYSHRFDPEGAVEDASLLVDRCEGIGNFRLIRVKYSDAQDQGWL